MARDPWLPIGYELPKRAKTRVLRFHGPDWQIFETQGGGRVLVAKERLARRWTDSGLIGDATLQAFRYGERRLYALSCGVSHALGPVHAAESPNSKSEALAFALALQATREIDGVSPLQDALYVEKITRLLPTFSISSRSSDDVVLGYWLSGGAGVSATSFRRLVQAVGWLGTKDLRDVVEAAGLQVSETMLEQERPALSPGRRPERDDEEGGQESLLESRAVFDLPGRPELATFFKEHIIDVIRNRSRYEALGIGFPSAAILHGPPGCGKTYAVDRLIEFLGWPSFRIEASSVASPYIHETSRKIAQVFEDAARSAPSVLVIDEMEAFLSDRANGAGSNHHRVEEVAEFLRRIPEASENQVLVLAMTNRLEMIDPAIRRRGRFDHLVPVDYASEEEVRSLLDKLLSAIPTAEGVDATPLARKLAGRPLSDVAFVVREAARLAARGEKERLDQESLLEALHSTPGREPDEGRARRRIGFV